LGSPSFVDFYISRSVPAGLVAELIAQHRPTSVQDRLCHPGPSELGRADIADDDQLVIASDPSGPLMQMVTPRVGDLRMDGADTLLVPGALLDGKRSLISAVMPLGRNCNAITASGEGFKPKIDTDPAISGGQCICDLALKHDVPTTARILHERRSRTVTTKHPARPRLLPGLKSGVSGAENTDELSPLEHTCVCALLFRGAPCSLPLGGDHSLLDEPSSLISASTQYIADRFRGVPQQLAWRW
jgi:hypothetical protein